MTTMSLFDNLCPKFKVKSLRISTLYYLVESVPIIVSIFPEIIIRHSLFKIGKSNIECRMIILEVTPTLLGPDRCSVTLSHLCPLI